MKTAASAASAISVITAASAVLKLRLLSVTAHPDCGRGRCSEWIYKSESRWPPGESLWRSLSLPVPWRESRVQEGTKIPAGGHATLSQE